MSTTPSPTKIRVPVWQVAKESYRSVFGEPVVFVKLAWLPGLVVVLMVGTFFYFFFNSVAELLSLDAGAMPKQFFRAVRWTEVPTLLGGIVLIGLISAFAVKWHRFRLLGETSGGMLGLFGREWRRFTGYALLIYSPSMLSQLVKIIADFVPGSVPSIGGMVGTIVDIALTMAWLAFTAYAFGCSLIFPAAAYGRPIGWHQAWRYLHGNFWRLAACCFVAGFLSFVTCLPVMLLLMLLLPPVGSLGGLGMTALMTVFEFIFVALFASILCGFYRRLVLARDDA
jgi:hypothetical protein